MEFIRWCDEVIVINFGDYEITENNAISKSKGVQHELRYATELGKEIKYYKYNFGK